MNNAYSANITVNSCGATLNSGNHYILNFTNPVITAATNCLSLGDGNTANIKITQVNDKLIVDSGLVFTFIAGSGRSLRHSLIEGVNIEVADFDASHPITAFLYQVGGSAFENNTFRNVRTRNFRDVHFAQNTGGGALIVNDNSFHDSFFLNQDYFIRHFTTASTVPRQMTNTVINNTLIDTNVDNIFISGPAVVSNNNCDTCVLTLAGDFAGTSIIKGTTDTDVDNDNIGDFDVNRIMSVPIVNRGTNYLFVQDLTEGDPFLSAAHDITVPINSETAITGVSLDGITNLNFINISYDAPNQLNLVTGSLSCDLFESSGCNHDFVSSTILNSKFRGFVQLLKVGSDPNYIEGQHFTSSTNEVSLISNGGDVNYGNFDFRGNTLVNSEFRGEPQNGDITYPLMFKGSNIGIYNNTVEIDAAINYVNGFSNIYLESNSPSSNNIHNNTFTSNHATQDNIFTTFGQSFFYNNYIDSGIVISNNSNIGVITSKNIGFNHTDDKIYYFTIGNFYEDNGGCVDVNVDGRCDSPFTSGSIVDNNPITSYPFDYTSFLGQADFVVDDLAFNVTLTNPEDLTSYFLDSAGQSVEHSFTQDSSFPDLTCSWIIDGQVEFVVNNANTTQSTSFSGFAEGLHSFRVECFNSFRSATSPEITYFIDYNGGISPPDNFTQVGGMGSTNETSPFFQDFDLFSGDSDKDLESGTNVINKSFSAILGGGYYIALILMAVFSVGVLFSLVRLFS